MIGIQLASKITGPRSYEGLAISIMSAGVATTITNSSGNVWWKYHHITCPVLPIATTGKAVTDCITITTTSGNSSTTKSNRRHPPKAFLASPRQPFFFFSNGGRAPGGGNGSVFELDAKDKKNCPLNRQGIQSSSKIRKPTP
ncbi:uncharacterized protein LOC129748527 isoform X2 [Uranotaenia lowii]|uniref:uncharacterized protein LOC129748527 isoform X2 n=1 Tax=Uranotaenia lowii TaxID=190385 RepID=UPI002478452A|nr:uncharacterized protein LOC129748527 isoform X2 [Uranotaenia lowii]